jgi:hypothetical protein
MRGVHSTFCLGGSDPKLVNRILRRLGREEITNSQSDPTGLVNADLSPPFEQYFVEFLRRWSEVLNSIGHGNLAACLLDEPDHQPRPERMNFYNRIFRMAEEGTPETKLYGVYYHAGDEEKLSPHHWVWSTNRPNRNLANICRSYGKKFHIYHGGFRYFQIKAEEARYRIGFINWIFNSDGTYFWADLWEGGKSVLDPTAVDGDSGPSSLSVDLGYLGALGTVPLMGVREGVDDRRYWETLRKLAEKHREAQNTTLREEAEKHLAFIQGLQNDLYQQSPEEYIRTREDVPEIEVTNSAGRSEYTNSIDFPAFLREEVAIRCESLMRLIIAVRIKSGEIKTGEKLTFSYPNPFNPECYLPVKPKGKKQDVKCKIYNILGQLVREIECSRVQGFKGSRI